MNLNMPKKDTLICFLIIFIEMFGVPLALKLPSSDNVTHAGIDFVIGYFIILLPLSILILGILDGRAHGFSLWWFILPALIFFLSGFIAYGVYDEGYTIFLIAYTIIGGVASYIGGCFHNPSPTSTQDGHSAV